MNKEDLNVCCYNESLAEAGLGHVFRRRAARLSKRVRFLRASTILVPVFPGSIVLAYGSQSSVTEVAIAVFLALSIAIAVFSAISLALGYDEQLSYFYESSSHHSQLSSQFESLAKNSTLEINSCLEFYAGLKAEQKIRDQQDEKYNFSVKDERRAMRYGLRQFGRACVACKKIPVSVEPTHCDVCGNF
jgi:mobilome CxxCx(11)CxxC protein